MASSFMMAGGQGGGGGGGMDPMAIQNMLRNCRGQQPLPSSSQPPVSFRNNDHDNSSSASSSDDGSEDSDLTTDDGYVQPSMVSKQPYHRNPTPSKVSMIFLSLDLSLFFVFEMK